MIASLPMYDRPEIARSTNLLWAMIRDRLRGDGIEAPEMLTRSGSLWDHWRAPDLVLSQTCGLPFRKVLHEEVALIGTPDFGLPGCPPGHYNSVLLVRRNETRTAPEDWPALHLACNEDSSQSGWAAPLNHAAALGTRFGRISFTGAHRTSTRWVAEGRADICCCDAHTWRMIQLYDRYAATLKEIGRTQPTPGLPLISARHDEAGRITEAVRAAIGSLPAPDRRALGIVGFEAIPVDAYLAIPTPEPA